MRFIIIWIALMVVIGAPVSRAEIPSPPMAMPEAIRPIAPSATPAQETPTSNKEEVAPEVIIANCKSAYAELERENALLKSKAYAAQESYFEYFYGDYARKRAEIQLGTFVWQARASEILIWVVVIICLSGVAFSGYQLWRATAPGLARAGTAAPAAEGAEAEPQPGQDPLATTMNLSLQNVRITSSVIGLVVLVISVAYLYLFLKEVYNVKVVNTFEVPANAAQPSKAPVQNEKPE